MLTWAEIMFRPSKRFAVVRRTGAHACPLFYWAFDYPRSFPPYSFSRKRGVLWSSFILFFSKQLQLLLLKQHQNEQQKRWLQVKTNASKLIKVICSHDRFTPMLCYVLVRHFITSQVFKERERYKTYNYKTDIKKGVKV